MKIIAFDNIKEVVQSAYVIAFRFFLLKSALFDLIQIEKKLLHSDNPFNSKHWGEFKGMPFFAKVTNGLFKQESRIADLLEDHLPKANALLMASHVNIETGIQNYLNTDFY